VVAPVQVAALSAYAYISQRFTWTDKEKEKVFKEQFVTHAIEKLQPIVDSTSADCSNQVEK